MGELNIQYPLALRILGVLGPAAMAAFLIVATLTARGNGGAGVVLFDLAGLLIAGVTAWRAPFVYLRASGQEIVVRNYWQTHHIPLWQAEGTDTGAATARGFATVRLLTGRGPVPVDALIMRDMQKHRMQIEAWVAEAKALHVGDPGESYQTG